MLIYKIQNKLNGKIYIGKTEKTLEERFFQHLKNAKRKINRYLYDSMNHYGYENFEVSLVEKCKDPLELSEKEIYWINHHNSLYPNGYNMTSGGTGGYTLGSWSEEERIKLYKKQALTRTGMKRTEDQKNNFKLAAKKRERDMCEKKKKDRSEKISRTLKSKYESGELIPNVPRFYGEDHPLFISVDIDDVLNLIQNGAKLTDIAKKYNASTGTIRNRLEKQTGKTFINWRRHYGIRGTFGNPRRNDSSRQ
jgi:group I intron endonuclease